MNQDLMFRPSLSDAPASGAVVPFVARAGAAGKGLRIALVGNFAPRKCGIATFTTDLHDQLRTHRPQIGIDVYALDDAASPLVYPEGIAAIDRHDPAAYERAARRINDSAPDAVWLQHEYGIFGGDCGDMVCSLVDRLAVPLILTLHTVLLEPSDKQRAILRHLISRASRIMVMSQQSRRLLGEVYDAPAEVIEVIEHGAPDRPFGRQARFRAELGHPERRIITTFGLLGPGKGIETVIEALPRIVARHPAVLYRVVGATHPNLVASEGEAYREGLIALAERLGVTDYVEWENRFLDTEELLDQLEASDIYITPYPNLQQSTSGTLSYAVALGKAVVSTPYVHARELLADGAGVLIEPRSAQAVADAVIGLLDQPDRLQAVQRRAYDRGRLAIWPRFAEGAAALIARAAAPKVEAPPLSATPGLSGVLAMCDGTGMLQHAIGVVPDRRHGYCLDDNARALMLMHLAQGLNEAERARWSLTFASFIQDAWNEERGRFRNFMRYDRSWCEEEGSSDSNGRALWALGRTIETAPDPALTGWALAWYDRVLPHLGELDSPRTVAFVMLGACARLRAAPGHLPSQAALRRGIETLSLLLDRARRPDWAWFEAVLGYDNPRLCQALIEAGDLMGDARASELGLETLAWIAAQQVSATGNFRPVGSESFGRRHDYLPFDQQPLEAQAAIEAAVAAHRATGAERWLDHAHAAWRWFFGGNDRGVVLADISTGRCRDGITPRGANENCGAESILAFQLSHYSMLALAGRQTGVRGEENVEVETQYSG
jgi:glycosyltransferase involved in cell wall biosynthesis